MQAKSVNPKRKRQLVVQRKNEIKIKNLWLSKLNLAQSLQSHLQAIVDVEESKKVYFVLYFIDNTKHIDKFQ